MGPLYIYLATRLREVLGVISMDTTNLNQPDNKSVDSRVRGRNRDIA